MKNKKYQIENLAELEAFSLELTQFLKTQKLPFYLLLTGDLGAGKTSLTKMLLKNLGVNDLVTSPTFVILNQYQTKDYLINHMDAYRLTANQELEMYFEEFNQGLNIIEWPENLGLDWNDYSHLKLEIKIIDENQREITIE